MDAETPEPNADATTRPDGAESTEALRAARPKTRAGLARQIQLEQLMSSVLGASAEPTTVGRFEVREKVGEGGMGAVYRAYDPELEREVALKFLNAGDSQEERERISREARTLARFSHPNVVTIHEVGSVDEQVYFVMEYLPRGNLSDWIDAHPDGQIDELLDFFLGAAKGLHAAHLQGLVHRDFKPQNILIANDGRALVSDFGVATLGSVLPSASQASMGSTWGEGELTPPTQPAGTPAYMSPEQMAGGLLDARSDQYSFCKSLKKCLRVLRRARKEMDAKRKRQLDELLARGLAERPQDRYPSMLELLGALESIRHPPRRGRRLAWAAAITLGLGGVSYGAWVATNDPLAACVSTSNRLVGALDLAAPKLRASWSTLERGEETFAAISPRLRAYANAWSGHRREACEATWQDGEQSTAVLDLRHACLDRRADQYASLLEALTVASIERLDAAPRAVASLPELEACARTDALVRTAADDTVPPEQAQRIAELGSAFARVRARLDLGDLAGLAEELTPLVEEARRLGHASTLAQGLRALADAKEQSGDTTREALLRESYVTAQRAGDDDVSLEAALALSDHAYGITGNFEDARFWADNAQAIADRISAPPMIRARIHAARGYAAMFSMDYDGAVRELDAATSALEGVERGQVLRLRLNINRTQVLDLSGNSDQAHALIEATVAALPEYYGARHPVVLKARSTQATVLLGMGRLDDARRAYEELLEVYASTGLPFEPERVAVYLNLGELERQAGNYEEAVERLQRALRLLDDSGGAERHYVTANFNLSAVYEFQGKYEQGLAAAREAAAHLPEDVEENDPQLLASVRVNEAVMLLRLERTREANEMLEHSLSSLEATLGESHVSLLHPLIVRGQARLEAEQWTAALEDAERGLALLGAPEESDAYERGQFSSQKGQALLASGELEPAASALEVAIESFEAEPSERAWALFHLARVRVAQGQSGEARSMMAGACEGLSKAEAPHDQKRHLRCKTTLAGLR